MTVATPFLARTGQFASVGSTNDVVREWLAVGEPEVCLATADEQTAGRGRNGRSWSAPAGAGLLLSLGFRPSWLDPELVWRLPAVVGLAMAAAAEDVARLADGAIGLKWPNDLVLAGGNDTSGDVAIRKLGGVLGESSGLGTSDAIAIVGIGINVDWRRDAFPPELAGSMTSLSEARADGSVDRTQLLEAFLADLERRVERLRDDRFDAADWERRQVTTGRLVDLHRADGQVRGVRATGVNPRSGALVVEDHGASIDVFAAEVVRVRLAQV